MKRLFVYLCSMMLVIGLGTTSVFAQNKVKKVVKMEKLQKAMLVKKATFGVRGNCSKCKKTIEAAAMSVKGVISAKWDKKKKKINVEYDENTIKIDRVHQAIAHAGYDTDMMQADPSVYKKLPKCCKYDHNMKMNLE